MLFRPWLAKEVYYPVPLHLRNASPTGLQAVCVSGERAWSKETIALPVHPSSRGQAHYVVECLRTSIEAEAPVRATRNRSGDSVGLRHAYAE